MAIRILGGPMYYVDHSIIKEQNPIVIDCRFELSQPMEGFKNYMKAHLEGAFYMDLEKDMTDEVKEHGGRHPLKSMDDFMKKIRRFGIDKNSSILVYDDGNLAMATRLWFMLKLVGLKNIYVLKGGFKALELAGYPMSNQLPQTSTSSLELDFQSNLICNIDEVKLSLRDEHSVVIDARANNRYDGLEEPIDFVAGHIPSTINYFWQDTLKEDFNLDKHFEKLKEYKTVINHCGSGVTGCVNMFFMTEAQITSKLYLGSYSDWISYDDNEIVVKGNVIVKVKQVKNGKNKD